MKCCTCNLLTTDVCPECKTTPLCAPCRADWDVCPNCDDEDDDDDDASIGDDADADDAGIGDDADADDDDDEDL